MRCWPQAPTCCRYYESADIWAFGMLLIELARGRAPYANFSLTNIIMMTLHSDPPELDSDCHCEVCQLCSAVSCTIRGCGMKINVQCCFLHHQGLLHENRCKCCFLHRQWLRHE